MVFGNKSTEQTIKTGNSEIKGSDYEQLLGITFNKKLNFKNILRTYVKKRIKIHEILMNSFISSQFNYRPLVWMFNDRATNRKLNRTFE